VKLPVFRAIGATFVFAFSNIVKFIFVPLAAGLVATEIINRLDIDLGADLNDLIAALQTYFKLLGSGAPGDQILAALGDVYSKGWVLLAVELIASAVLFTGGLRFALRLSDGISYNFGIDELRVLITWILLGIVNFLVGMAAAIPIGALSTLPSSGAVGIAVIGIVVIAAVFLVWFTLRTSLAAPAAVAEHRLGIAGSFRATKGNSWRLLSFWILVTLCSFVVTGIFGAIFGAVWQALAHHKGPTPQLFAGSFVLGFLLQQAFLMAASGTAYRLMTTQPPEA
jgi:hypothetical protein